MTARQASDSTTEGASPVPLGGRQRRISPRVRHAIKLRVEKGLTGEEAARVAGLSSAGFWKAWVQPHVQQLYHDTKQAYIQRVTERRDVLKARALEVAEELLGPDQPANVRARMVEFLAGEARPSGPSVQINVQDRASYTFAPPRDITPPETDLPSSGAQAQGIEE